VQEDRFEPEVTFGVLFLLAIIVVAAAGFVCMQAWRGNWQVVAITLGLPLLLAALLAALAASGKLNSGHSEDWGPMLALLAAAAIATISVVTAIVAGIVGFFGHRRRAATVEQIF
jgi:hypothetical protein